MRRFPSHAEVDEPCVTALGTGAVSGCERGGFIQEEEFGVSIRGHHGSLSAAKLQNADEPALQDPLPPEATLRVVQDAAIAHERAPLGRRNNLPERRDPVLLGQRGSSGTPTWRPYCGLRRAAGIPPGSVRGSR